MCRTLPTYRSVSAQMFSKPHGLSTCRAMARNVAPPAVIFSSAAASPQKTGTRKRLEPGGVKMRIGVAGLNGAGKTEVVRFLESRSFHGASLSDVIRQDLEREGREPSRENMIERGRALRKSFGPSVLAERAA